MKIALATCAAYPDLGLDGPALTQALEERGLQYAPLVWNDPTIDWNKWDLCLLHSTWDYHHHRPDFLDWAEKVSSVSRLWNPLEAVSWNNHKSYLLKLETKGIPVIPTCWLQSGDTVNLAGLLEEKGWPRAIIKPSVGGSAFGARLVTRETTVLEESQTHLNNLLATRDVMVQPVVRSLETYGEHSLIFIDGELTHTVHRASSIKAGEGHQAGETTLIIPKDEEIELAYRTLSQVQFPLLYARLDIIQDDEGIYRLIELEIIEPALFFSLNTRAAQRLVQGIINRVNA